MKELLPALLCIIIMIYIIYTELKNRRPERDLFVDTSISIIIMIVGLYSMYEYHFDFSLRVVQAYIVLLALGIAYLVIVFVRNQKSKEDVSHDSDEQLSAPHDNNQDSKEEHQDD